jgi:CBS domain-containing protein
MHSGVETVDAATPLAAVARLMRDRDIGAVPVLDHGLPVGVVTDRDIVVRGLACDASASAPVSTVMTEEAICCAPDDAIADALRVMEERQVRRLLVREEDGELVGIVSLGDLAGRIDDDLQEEVLIAVAEHHA